MWGDTPESCHRQVDDIFDLRPLFGEEPYDIVEEEEEWISEDWVIEEEEQNEKRKEDEEWIDRYVFFSFYKSYRNIFLLT